MTPKKPETLMEDITEYLVDEEAPASRDTPASTSRESDQEFFRKVVSGKHSIFNLFAKGRNCEV